MPVRPFVPVLAAALALATAAAAQSVDLRLDEEATVGGVEVACTGVGQTRLDPHWADYSVRIEVSNARNEYLTDAEIAVSDSRGRPVASVSCPGPWILLQLAPGAYRVDARLPDQPVAPRNAPFRAPAKGQVRVVVQFPDAP